MDGFRWDVIQWMDSDWMPWNGWSSESWEHLVFSARLSKRRNAALIFLCRNNNKYGHKFNKIWHWRFHFHSFVFLPVRQSTAFPLWASADNAYRLSNTSVVADYFKTMFLATMAPPSTSNGTTMVQTRVVLFAPDWHIVCLHLLLWNSCRLDLYCLH